MGTVPALAADDASHYIDTAIERDTFTWRDPRNAVEERCLRDEGGAFTLDDRLRVPFDAAEGTRLAAWLRAADGTQNLQLMALVQFEDCLGGTYASIGLSPLSRAVETWEVTLRDPRTGITLTDHFSRAGVAP
jgi:hypothetical protein